MKFANVFKWEPYARRLLRGFDALSLKVDPDYIGVTRVPPGTFYSPLLPVSSLPDGADCLPYDGEDNWEFLDLRLNEQKELYLDLLTNPDRLQFPNNRDSQFRYHGINDYFPLSDAFLLSGIIDKASPKRIIEVGSGFSSAVILDTLDRRQRSESCSVVFVEPYPERLESLLRPSDRQFAVIRQEFVQEVPLAVFDKLESGDILFIDSSHVAKVGSDVTFLILRILPRLQAGVLVHVHDIVYPHTYPIDWIQGGLAWNESLFLRAFLIGNSGFEVVAFNSFAARSFPEVFKEHHPGFLESSGGSLWLRRV